MAGLISSGQVRLGAAESQHNMQTRLSGGLRFWWLISKDLCSNLQIDSLNNMKDPRHAAAAAAQCRKAP